MGKRVFTKKKMPKVSAENADKIFHGRNAARLGTEKNPAAVTVRSEKREQEIAAVFEEHGWKHTISVDP
ncbi:MAG: hypothetical protein GY868_03340, partial [Deltaproteobacteria bacterium]|nr:hypothetical protein [Deltaproteobacteria bacterium]